MVGNLFAMGIISWVSNFTRKKTTGFSKPKYIGDPINTVKIFNEKEVDEIVLLDIGASKNSTPPDMSKISEIAGECFMPLAYGGAGCIEDFVAVVVDGKASAVTAGSFFVYNGSHRVVLVNYPDHMVLVEKVYRRL